MFVSAEYNIKRKKRKIGLPYSGGISVSQILAHREKVALNQHSFNKELVGNPHQHAQPTAARLSGFPGEPPAAQALRYREGAAAGQQAAAHAAPSGGPGNGPAHIQSHRIVGPDGRVVEVQGSMVGSNHGQRIFVNGQPNEPTGPGRPQTVQMVPVSQAAGHVMSQSAGHVMSQAAGHVMSQAAGHVMSQAAGHVMNQATGHLMNQQRAQQQQQLFYNSHAQYQQGHGFDGSKNVRPFAGQMMVGFRPHGMMGQGGQMAQGPIVMNGQPNLGPPQIIANSPTQQINLLQPVNLINGPAGMVQNFPAIQQFIVPNLGGMVMNADGSATILQDTSNLGVQLQIQNVNGQNVLTPVQNNGMFAAGMVIRSPASQGKQHSPGAQFLSPGGGGQFVVNGGQFGGQLSPLNQQVAFGAPAARMRPGDAGQEYVQLGQTLMVPCAPSVSVAGGSAGRQNATFVQQNTTIVQQQTTMVANNQQVMVQQQQQHQQHSRPSFPTHHGQSSVSTQTAINQPPPSLTSNPFRHAPASCDTTTLSPLPTGGRSSSGGGRGSGGRSPPTTADTTTHAGGSTDDAASPAPSVCSGGGGSEAGGQSRPQSCTMPDGEWRRAMQGKALYDASPFDRRTAAAGGSYSDEATVVEVGGFHYVAEQVL
ncbi:unnamed protein product [Phaedon cochleariae]|uniref:Uncharacterized protein n=1 Tax=Phaedon cochleariae TaxID=80249 RepID=A0A9N9SLB6_PHACE|nr:unnamed protein product [Phaedon cochleariae]